MATKKTTTAQKPNINERFTACVKTLESKGYTVLGAGLTNGLDISWANPVTGDIEGYPPSMNIDLSIVKNAIHYSIFLAKKERIDIK